MDEQFVLVKYNGTGTVLVDGCGEVRSGGSIRMSEALATLLTTQDPETWQRVGEQKHRDGRLKRDGGETDGQR